MSADHTCNGNGNDKVEGAMEQLKFVAGVTKQCTTCKVVKNIEEFGKSFKVKESRTIIKSQCKVCLRNVANERNRDRRWARSRKNYIARIRGDRDIPALVKIKIARSRVAGKLYGYLPCTTPDYILIRHYTTSCMSCGEEIGDSICLDHCHTIGYGRGYICHECNTLAAAADNPKLLLVLEYLKCGPLT